MKVAYSFSVLRYVHDPTTQEFVNIGVAVFSAEAKYLQAKCTLNYGRITDMFQEIDGARFRQVSRFIQDQICSAGQSQEVSLPFSQSMTIEQALARVLPPDDSAIQFSKSGVGLSSDLDRTLAELYKRHVEQYVPTTSEAGRTDEDVWRVFKEPLDRVMVTPRLSPKLIVAPDFEYDFQRSWKNEIWHVYEPLSFDMIKSSSILDKANRWVGRATSLADSSEPFRMHMLLGEPADSRLRGTFIKAQNILYKMPGKKEFIRESEAEDFAAELAREVAKH
jgi:hypothetical protein